MDYDTLLKNAPAHDSDEFLQYLRDNNVVVLDSDAWLVIENCKYHTSKRPWYTAFYVGERNWHQEVMELYQYDDWRDWEWLKKSADKQTVKRFHIHIYKPNPLQ